ncbi:MAG: ATP-binding protein [Patescibacteria group bacterium]
MDLYILIIIGVVNILLGLRVLINNSRSATNKLFFLFICITIAWSTANYIATSYLNVLNVEQSIFWVRLTMFFAVPQAVSFFFLVHTFPESRMVLKKKYFFGLIFFATVTMIVALSPFLFVSVAIQDGTATPNPGPGMALFLPVAVGSVIAGLIKLIKKYIRASSLEKIQLRYIFLGLFFMFLLILTFNFGFVVFLKDISFVTFAPLFTLPFLVTIFYAITRHRFLDIRVIISRSIIYFFLVLAVTFAFSGTIFVFGAYFQGVLGGNAILTSLAVSLIIVLGLEPLKRFLGKVTDRIFFKSAVDYGVVLKKLSEISSREIDIYKLVRSTNKNLNELLKISRSLIILENKSGHFEAKEKVYLDEYIILKKNGPLISYIKKDKSLIILEELDREISDMADERKRAVLEKVREEMEKYQIDACVPITAQDKMNAILILGRKLSGDTYSSEDIKLLDVLSPQVGSAIEKAKLYDEVKSFGLRMREEVKKATGDLRQANIALQERNRFLTALQKISNMVSHTLDFDKVTQNIVDAIAKEVGFIGGLLLMIDKENDRIYPQALTQSSLTKQVLKIIPKPFREYYSKFSTDKTIDAMAAKTGRIKIGSGFEQFISPPLPKPVCYAVNKMLKVKSIVAVPIFSENEVIGIIDFVLAKEEGEISQQEIEMMKAIADQTGIVASNLRLFEQIQKANNELEKVNKHLLQLDKAKSEFISIASHQLRTPMTGIMGYLSMLTSGDFGKIDPKISGILADLLKASKRMIRLINLFLNVSRIEAGRFTLDLAKIDMVNLIDTEIKEVINIAKEKGLKLIFKKPVKQIPPVMADESKVADIILNLVDNAIKYTPKGNITVTIDRYYDDKVIVRVKDTGMGIDTDEAHKLFGKFARGEGMARVNPDGSGLGLFIAKRVVEAHDGNIWAESEGQDKGSTFQFILPIDGPKNKKF